MTANGIGSCVADHDEYVDWQMIFQSYGRGDFHFSLYMEKSSRYILRNISYCFSQNKESHIRNMSWGWVNEDNFPVSYFYKAMQYPFLVHYILEITYMLQKVFLFRSTVY